MYQHYYLGLWVSITQVFIGHCDLYFMVQWFLSKTFWYMNIVLWDYGSVWPDDVWHQNKCRSMWPLFHGPVILLNIFKIIWWMNIIVGIMDQCDTQIDLPRTCRSVTYILWSSDFASYLEDYLMEKCCTWDNGSVWLKDRPCKIYMGQWPIFHGPLILPYTIVID